MTQFQTCFYTNYLCDGMSEFCDTPPGGPNDCNPDNCGPPDKPYICCWPCVTPITMVIDIISCPCRYINFRKKKVDPKLNIHNSVLSI